MQNGKLPQDDETSFSYQTARQTTNCSRKMSAEMLDTAEETIMDFIKCPYCNDYVRPPSFCCENGHFICHGCKEHISRCPSCGSKNYPNKKNAVFDMILMEIYYPCYYQSNGCSAYFKYKELEDHQLRCRFKLEPCAFQSEGCRLFFSAKERAVHEQKCEFGVSCRIYANTRGVTHPQCSWRGAKGELPKHVAKCHRFPWCPNQVESNVALAWALPMNCNLEKVELVHLKDVDEMFYFYSRSVANSQHFIAAQYIGNKGSWQDFMYSVEFVHEEKKVGFQDLVLPFAIPVEDIYKSPNCFSVHYDFLKKHFPAGKMESYVKIFKKGQRILEARRYLTNLDNVIK